MTRLRAALAAWEAAWAAVATSPWASLLWALYTLAWILAEAERGKAIGWDGAGQWLLGEVTLSTLRRVSR